VSASLYTSERPQPPLVRTVYATLQHLLFGQHNTLVNSRSSILLQLISCRFCPNPAIGIMQGISGRSPEMPSGSV